MNYDKASNALVTVTGFYADALADLTGQRDSLMEQRSLLAKELQATQARENTLDHVLECARNFLREVPEVHAQTIVNSESQLAALIQAVAMYDAKR